MKTVFLNNTLAARVKRMLAIAGTAVLAFYLTACGGSSGSGPVGNAGGEEVSELLVSLTDAEGDFLTYEVEVSAITMTRANGATVEVLPRSTRVDFAQYVEATEMLTIADAPSGSYTSAVLSLDFSAAIITVQDDAGNPIQAAVVDADGSALGAVDVAIKFNDRDGFVLAPGIAAHVTLDFDLDASNEIVIDGDQATVTVNPVLLADTIWQDDKVFRLRGLLGAVSEEEGGFAINLRPFHARSGLYGSARVYVSSDTSFEIDGEIVAAEAGLATLANLGAGAAVVTEGSWNKDTHVYLASAVYAGSSVPWGESDVLRGTVVARSDNSIAVRGALLELADGRFVFNDTVTVTVDESTSVLKFREGEAGIEDISVGSAVLIIGEVSDDSSMNASGGIVRIAPSTIAGSVVSASPLTLNLSYINRRRVAIYDFSGTGSSAETDALAENYEVFTGALNLDGVNVGDPIRARGVVADFGAAPEDFFASSVVNAASVRGHMGVNYPLGGSATAVASLDESGLQLNIEDALIGHHIVRAGIFTDLLSLSAAPLVVPADERGIFAISLRGELEVYTYYADFQAALEAYLVAGEQVKRFDAQGFYDSLANTFTTQRLRVQLATIAF